MGSKWAPRSLDFKTGGSKRRDADDLRSLIGLAMKAKRPKEPTAFDSLTKEELRVVFSYAVASGLADTRPSISFNLLERILFEEPNGVDSPFRPEGSKNGGNTPVKVKIISLIECDCAKLLFFQALFSNRFLGENKLLWFKLLCTFANNILSNDSLVSLRKRGRARRNRRWRQHLHHDRYVD